MKKVYELNLPVSDNLKKISPRELIHAERLLRLNPIWIIQEFKEDSEGFHAKLKDHSTDVEFELHGTLQQDQTDALIVDFTADDYANLMISSTDNNYQATVTYADPDFQEESELEHNTVLWLRSIQEYLKLYQKKTVNTLLFRYIMNRIVLTMTPSQRKICLMLLRVTIVELVVILFIVIGYVFFVLKP